MPVRHRRRRLAVAATTFALAVPTAATTLAVSPARSADPVEDCVQAFPVGELAAGDDVTGLSVVRGTTPTGFTGEVLGVIEDGIALDVDMIMVEIEMPEMARAGGVWQGMSGSPVYAADGRLVGAVAYGLSQGPSPIAGVTPYEEMDDHLAGPDSGTPAPSVAVSRADARTIAARAGISTAEAARGFRELPVPTGITGLTARRLAQLQAGDNELADKSSYVLGRAAEVDAGAESMVAGGNIGASFSYGDITMAGVGTVTSVCDGRVVGFGHPLAYLGSTGLGLHPADAVYVQPDPVSAPFKVANIAPPVGTVTEDRLTGIAGTFGPVPPSIPVTSEVTYGQRARTGTSQVLFPEAAGEVTFYQMIANQDRVVDGAANGTELLSWRIRGTEDGEPFVLGDTDRYTGHQLTEDLAYGVAMTVEQLTYLDDDVDVTSVSADATLTDDLRRSTIAAVEQRRSGTWVRVTRRAPAQARPGSSVRLRVVLGGSAGRKVVTLKPITLRKRAKGTLVLHAQGGDSFYYYPEFEGEDDGAASVDDIRTSLRQQLRHDQVRVQVGTPDKLEHGYDGEDIMELRVPPRPPYSFVQRVTSTPQSHVVGGDKSFTLVVR